LVAVLGFPQARMCESIRSFAYNLLRAGPRENIKNARWRAGLDINQFLETTAPYWELNSPGRPPIARPRRRYFTRFVLPRHKMANGIF
jgi:hypothetical protein